MSIGSVVSLFGIFYAHVGSKMIIFIAISAFSTLVEGVGLIMFLPLLELMGGSDFSSNAVLLTTRNIFLYFGLEVSLNSVLIAIGLLFVLKGLILMFADFYKGNLRSILTKKIKSNLFDIYASLHYQDYLKRDSRAFVNNINGETSKFIRGFIAFVSFLKNCSSAVIYFVFAIFISWQFALFALIIGFVFLIIFKYLNNFLASVSHNMSREASFLTYSLIQFFGNFKYFSATNGLIGFRKDIFSSIRRLAAMQRHTEFATAFTARIREPLSVILFFSLIIFQIEYFEMQLEMILVSGLLFYRTLNAIVSLQAVWQDVIYSYGSVSIVERELAASFESKQCDKSEMVPLDISGIEARKVCFSFESHEQGSAKTLSNIDISLEKGECVALVGPSGSGKTTFLDILALLLKPSSGRLLVNGSSSCEMKAEAYSRSVGYVTQDPVIFAATVASNVALKADELITPEDERDIFRILKELGLMSFVESLPDRIYTQIGQGAVLLSGGQKQRLAIARELFKRPRMLILDEATSALDPESEEQVLKALEKKKGSMIVVMAAHHFSSLKYADCVYVFREGKITEKGCVSYLSSLNESWVSVMRVGQSVHKKED